MKQIKKLSIRTIIISCLLCGVMGASLATDTGKITSETVRMRNEPSQDSSVVMLISLDEEVEILKTSGDWYQIKYQDKTGYISKNLVKTANSEQQIQNTTTENTVQQNTNTTDTKQEDQAVETQKEQEETNTDIVTIEKGMQSTLMIDCRLKLIARVDSSEIATGKKDSKITVTEVLNDWCKIETEEQSGWIRKATLTKAIAKPKQEEKKQEEQPQKEAETTKKAGYINVDSVNVRKETNTTSEVVTNLVKNDQVTILGEQDNWYKIEANGKQGYVSEKYISDKKVEAQATSRGTDTTRKAENTKTANKEETKNTNIPKGNDVVAYAKTFLGCRYVSGGNSPSSGFDCSGFTCYVYKHFGITLNRTSGAQMSNGTTVARGSMIPGDLIIFRDTANNKIGHVGIYIGGNQFIHAANASKGVIITSLSDSYYSQRFVAAKRII